MIDILHRYTKVILYHSETAQTIAEAVGEATRKRADLREADLCGANLREANLCEADLREADLCGANLCGANLCGADLRGANLYRVNLYRADLCGANLCGADLRGANLYRADLRGANLPVEYRIATICFGGWGVTVQPATTQIGCERHPNEAWLAWRVDAPEIAAMHPDAAVWWARHREAVCAVIRDVMQP